MRLEFATACNRSAREGALPPSVSGREARDKTAAMAIAGPSAGPARLRVTNRAGNRFPKRDSSSRMALLEIKNLRVALEDGTEIVKGVDLAVDQNEIHAIMGPNGSGKSTLAYALMGHPAYRITEGEILFDGVNLVEKGADERAEAGLFLAFQYPHAVPGVTVTSFLRSAINAIRKARAGQEDPIPIPEFRKELFAQMDRLK